MSGASNWLVHDHEHYDIALTECEEIAEEGLWGDAIEVYQRFVEDLKLHMRMEDEVLYPRFEEYYGDPTGELAYLSAEHDNIARLLHDLTHVIQRKDYEHFLVSLKPLHKALKQHNDNEESLFLSLQDDSILMDREEIMERLNAIQDTTGRRIWNI
jgi:hemerythrin-like domain-containing protein